MQIFRIIQFEHRAKSYEVYIMIDGNGYRAWGTPAGEEQRVTPQYSIGFDTAHEFDAYSGERAIDRLSDLVRKDIEAIPARE